MQHKVLYTADIHGNETQYKKLVDYAIKIVADTVIIGGDIAPKPLLSNNYIKLQKQFLEHRLPKLLSPLKKELPNSKLFLMMSNDDCKANLDVLEKHSPGLYQLIHGERINLTKEFDIMGYSYVPITPFGIKDWEKFDLSNVPPNLNEEYENRKRTNYRLSGIKSTKFGWKEFKFSPDMEKQDSIQKDLSDKMFQKNPNKTVYVIHTPPNQTNLDQVLTKNHVGSIAVRLFIEDYQPYLTLHGHIHETVDVSGDFKDNIGKTLCLTSGNHDSGTKLAVLVFDLYNPKHADRIIL
ncbi:MAG: metallophosphoesterase [Nanoarchaeota archaeon]|nr:metallophosphoesterase [Nanoarchaeota archaeon]MBU4283508.1 metallophosphoesterase [Nanoarchaeota archaeon]